MQPPARRVLKKRNPSTLSSPRLEEEPHPATTTTSGVLFADFATTTTFDFLTEQVLANLQPNASTEKHRLFVFDALSHILQKEGLQPYLFGSVAFKTYLPDGDLDVSVFEVTNQSNYAEPWYTRVKRALSEFHQGLSIRDIVFINAEVKVLKCVINDISVDISFQQAGGVCTLCFLEDVDRLVQKNHLFKKSVILAKLWAYYESRILASQHALLSTYAITILIMYILNRYYDEVHSPLQVLYKFLEYFSKFDWEHFGIGIQGPFKLSAMPQVMTIPDDTNNKPFFFSSEFLDSCKNMCASVPEKHLVDPQFITKYMNILDPIREYNNLGRSVSKNSYARIKRAMLKGFEMLKSVMDSGDTNLLLTQFFKCAWSRNGNTSTVTAPIVTVIASPFESDLFDINLEQHKQALETVKQILNNKKASVQPLRKNSGSKKRKKAPKPALALPKPKKAFTMYDMLEHALNNKKPSSPKHV